ncbi:MAG: hypothetical protein DMF84_18180 [Acidobacteria bacterium]|nr:MAG: hypothetical protein DMF84_18180 [Acidobacteriota bacterium]
MGAGSSSGSTAGGYGTTGSNPSATSGTAGTNPSSTAGTNPSSTSASDASSASGKEALTLKGKDDDLQKHVNHRVEIRGTLDKSATGGDTSMTNPPSTTAGTAGSTASSQGLTGTLTVSSVREISGSCSGGGNR